MDDIRVNEARRLLRDDENAAIRREPDLCGRRHLRAAQRAHRVGNRHDVAIVADRETMDAACASRVQHVQQAAGDGNADRTRAQRWFGVGESQALRRHVKGGNIVAACVHDIQPMVVLAEDNTALVAEPLAGAEAAGRVGSVPHQRTVGRPPIGEYLVALRRVAHRVDGSGSAPVRAGGLVRRRRREQRNNKSGGGAGAEYQSNTTQRIVVIAIHGYLLMRQQFTSSRSTPWVEPDIDPNPISWR
jgi:hypothetical protein